TPRAGRFGPGLGLASGVASAYARWGATPRQPTAPPRTDSAARRAAARSGSAHPTAGGTAVVTPPLLRAGLALALLPAAAHAQIVMGPLSGSGTRLGIMIGGPVGAVSPTLFPSIPGGLIATPILPPAPPVVGYLPWPAPWHGGYP